MIGVAAEIGEQDIKLFVKLKAGDALDPAALSGWLAERLAPYQSAALRRASSTSSSARRASAS